MPVKALRIRVIGIVQGVGFRPFIYRIARIHGLHGYVRNLGGSEVEIHIEGPEEEVREFLKDVYAKKPPPARIEEITVEKVKPAGYSDFVIEKSLRRYSRRSMIPPDFGICEYCMREILDPSSRFYRYYWNSCAWCGPRFSMMYTLPYDRDNTSMRNFPLCEACLQEYSEPFNIRRFHAQGISCPICGPKTYVYNSRGERIRVSDPVTWAAERLEEGYIIAIKGVGGYHIAALATDDSVVAKLRVRKHRPQKPFALMARDCDAVRAVADPPPGACELLKSPERPIVLLPKRDGSVVSNLVAPGLDSLGIMLPYTGFQVLLLREVRDGILIMTSGNRSGRPMCTTLECALSELADIVDFIVDHEREIVHRVDDSVVRFTDGELVLLRRARGYAPAWIRVKAKLPEGLAVGAELQVTGAVSFEDKIVPTQYIGDLDDPGNLDDLRRELKWFINIYSLRPKFVGLDMHPAYRSRELAFGLSEELGAEPVEVQHHHAHAASAMAELGVGPSERVVAVAIDGTGYGLDGTIWGGEVLLVSYNEFERVGHLSLFPLPGSERSIIWSTRSLIGLLAASGYGEDEVIGILRERQLLHTLPYGEREARVSYRQATGDSPLTSSLGRTLDAIASLLGVAWRRTYEGEQAVKLEAAARGGVDLGYTPPVQRREDGWVVDLSSMMRWLIDQLSGGIPINTIALTVQKGLGRALGLIAVKASSRATLDFILATGGAAVNTYIIQGIREAAALEGIEVKLQHKLPPGDGGVAVGQIMVGASKLGLL